MLVKRHKDPTHLQSRAENKQILWRSLSVRGAAGLAVALSLAAHAEEVPMAGAQETGSPATGAQETEQQAPLYTRYARVRDTQALFAEALERLGSQDMTETMALLQDALSRHPDSDRIRKELSLLALFLSRPPDTGERLQAEETREAEAMPQDAQARTVKMETLFNEGMRKVEEGDVESAMTLFESILGQRPESERVRMELSLLAAFLSRSPADSEKIRAARKAQALAEDETLFADALEELESGDLRFAMDSFGRILERHPESDRVRMELALAHLRSYDYAKAEAVAREIMQKPGTPPNVRVRIQQFMNAIQESSHPHKFTPYLSLGFKYDDNLNVGPSTDSVPGLGDLTANSLPKEDMAWVAMGGISHTLQTGKTIQFDGRTVGLFWQSGASLYRNDYFTEDEYDITVASLNTGPTLAAARSWRFNLDTRFDNIHLDTDHLADYITLNPSLSFGYAKGKVGVRIDAKWQDRDFKQAVYAGRDSDYLSGGLRLRYRPNKDLRLEVSGRMFDEEADQARYSRDGYKLGAGAEMRLPGMENSPVFHGHYTYENAEHDGVEPLFLVARDEREQTATVGVRYAIRSQHQHLDGWSLNADYTHTTNKSNITLYGYDRNRLGVSMGRAF